MSYPSAPPSYDAAVDEKNKFGPNQPTGYGAQPYPPQGGFSNPNFQTYPPEQPLNQQPPLGSAPPNAEVNTTPNVETAGFTTSGSFEDKNVRRLFIRKVFIVLGLQLLVTFGIVCVFTFVKPVGEFVKENSAIYYAAYGVFLVLYFALICCTEVRRKHPTNLILLFIFTLAFSYMVGTIASFYSTMSVVIALGTTVGVCLAIILFSMQTKFDFTKCSGLLFVLMLVLIMFGFVTIFTYYQSWYVHVVYGCLGALVFSLFLAFDTQLIMGGKKYELDPEEYVFGALCLYIDVVYIFLFLLSLFGSSN